MVDPGQVDTAMTKLFTGKLTWVVPTPSTFVQSAIKKLGFTSRTCGYWAHSFQNWFVSLLLPEWAVAAANFEVGKKQYRHAMYMKNGE